MNARSFELSVTDEAMAYLEDRSPMDLHMMVDLDRVLDEELLSEAWRRLAQRHPPLRFAFNRGRWSAGWRLDRDEIGGPVALNEIEGVPDGSPGPIELALLSRELTLDRGDLARVALIRQGTRARLVVSVHHALLDARSLAILQRELREEYSNLWDGRERGSGRSLDRGDIVRHSSQHLIDRVGWSAGALRTLQARLDRWRRLPSSAHVEPAPAKPSMTTPRWEGYARYDLAPALMERLEPVRRHANWTVNDVLLGALSAAWDDEFGARPGASCWLVPVDLRRAADAAGWVGNLSGLEVVALPSGESGSSGDRIAAASAAVEELRGDWFGFAGELAAYRIPALLRPLAGQSLRRTFDDSVRRRYTRALTNIGVLEDGLAQWGDAEVDRSYILAPPGAAPYVTVAATSYLGGLSLTAATHSEWLSEARFLRLAARAESRINDLVQGR